MAPKYLKGIVTYHYMTGSEEMKRRYKLNPHWHGPYDCDIDDFKKFFEQIRHGGDVTKLYLITRNGVYSWLQKTKTWTYIGK